jgi:hypothetical protein
VGEEGTAAVGCTAVLDKLHMELAVGNTGTAGTALGRSVVDRLHKLGTLAVEDTLDREGVEDRLGKKDIEE